MSMQEANSLATIRTARLEDVSRIREIARAAYAKYVSRIGREPAPMVANYEDAVAAQRVVVAYDTRDLVAYMVSWSETDAYFIENIGVEPKVQGKGLGRQLIDYAIGLARLHNLSALRLYTNVVMIENLAIYKHIGFIETHRAIEDGFHRIYMRLNLAEKATMTASHYVRRETGSL